MSGEVLLKALRGGHAQFDRIIKLDTPLGEDWLVPLYVKLHARLGRNFEVIVDASSVMGDKIKLNALILKPVTLWIRQTDGGYLPIHGYVQRARRLGYDGTVSYFQLQFSSWLSFLKLSSDRRDWQEASGWQILTDVFDKHPQASGNYAQELRAAMRSYSHRVQWETDWNFVHRCLEEVGVFARFDFAKDGKSHKVVMMDDLYFGPSLPNSEMKFSHAGTDEDFDGLTQLSEQQDAQSATLTLGTADYKRPDLDKQVGTPAADLEDLPGQGEDYLYTGSQTWAESDVGQQQARIRTEEWASRAKRYFAIGSPRYALPGYWFKVSGHPVLDSLPEEERELSIIASDWLIQNNLPGMDALTRFPRSLRSEIEQVQAAGTGATVSHRDGGVGFFHVEIEAQRRKTPFRSPFEHEKPEMHLQTAIVVTDSDEEILTDDGNRVRVRTSNSRNDRNQKSTTWIRAAMPDAGAKRGGYFPLRKDDQVLLGFVNGDCDRPVIISRLHGGATMPVWHTHGLLSGFRSREYGGDGFNQLVMDDSSGQNRVHLYSSSYSSHLHLGYLIEQSDNTRGAFLGNGFDLKSGAHGAVRAEQGLYVSTQPATAQPLNVTAATEPLAGAEAVFETVSKASETNRAESLQDGQAALKSFTDATQRSVAGSTSGGRTAGGGTGSVNGFSKPVMLLSSPEGIAASTQQSVHVTANQHANIVAGKNVNLAAGKSLLASVLDKISLFAQNLGIKIFAAKGPVDIQAQSGAASLVALQDVKIESADGRLILTAAKEVWIGAGGSYISIKGGLIENATTGQILEKCANWDKPGGASGTIRDPLQATPVSTDGGRGSLFSG
ncbi:type VI secretion system Vgr family protein [Burkholderia vietnamiensis]|uniref:Type VI secretion system tip protein VgrG n=1 Tax=Burkholderia vietnamiensis TaxID=60552 RepID=A0ABS1B4R7_BURVI|nr:type VI secretion system Vgr family protein [Burkholderia vietnamiensis]KVE99104.1 Rhs element Vgr protein [Burkholderia vietnamiensis]MBJ9691377.1 type VI secretion system tip protein VgrG [Burkholderia vietnamiensis]MBR8206799.1 type VI secretion system tip protein VgrG [Burkholderia vietnamiensis]MCA8395576.1 type VI secretion system tip protein VgrG [Burkholderia vietnamiensis]WHU95797.1 type VI secretion system Vgr family protein [Burkholderia vietnamiensis]